MMNCRYNTNSYDKANQLVSSTTDGKVTHYAYDAAGRLIKEGDKSYAYGWLDKVLSVTENGQQIASFNYHNDGQIAQAIHDGKSEDFLWDGLALIHRGETFFINEPYVTGGNPILSSKDGVMFNDMLGSTLNIGGKAINMTAFGESTDTNAMYTGKPYIGELGYAFLFRNYRSDYGKWQTTDPLGYPDGWNNLAYCKNAVSLSIDWLGASCLLWHSWEEVPGTLHEEETLVKVLVSHTFSCGGTKEQTLSYSEDTSFSISFQLQYQGTGIPVSYNASFKKSESFKVDNIYPQGHEAGVEHDTRGSYTYSLELYVITQTVLQQCKDCRDVEAVVKSTFFRTKDKISNEVKCVVHE